MAYSIGLTLYNLANRRDVAAVAQRPARPSGRLVWLHAPVADASAALVELARRLVDDDGLSVLITCQQTLPPRDGILQDKAPIDTPAEVRAFLDHWRPELLVLSDGELRPALLQEATEKSLPVIMVQAHTPYLLRERDGWYPGLMRSLLSRMHHVLTLDEPAARTFRKAGAPLTAVEVAGRMEDQNAVLPHTEAERASLAQILATRPVWLAAGLDRAEEDAVIVAHRRALRLAHRLLLIVVPQSAAEGAALADKMEQVQGWNVALRALDQEPSPEVEVIIADSAAELGLWYRLSPITFLGGSLSGKGCQRNPMEAASLGSALICGPHPGAFGAEFGRLGAARAMRAVGSTDELADALSELLAPDRAAHLANAGWGAVSDGAEVTDHVITLIRRIIDGDT
jgi:3-deoxy-D-manno-octulosonic-acid transferase